MSSCSITKKMTHSLNFSSMFGLTSALTDYGDKHGFVQELESMGLGVVGYFTLNISQRLVWLAS